MVDKSNIKDLKEFSNQFMIDYLLSGELLTVSSTIKHFLIDKDETEMDLVMGCQVLFCFFPLVLELEAFHS